MSYKNLVSVKIHHQYFGANASFNFELSPHKDTQEYLQKRGLLLKMTKHGFSIFYQEEAINGYDLKAAVLKEEFKLVFTWTATDTSFYNCTAGIDKTDHDSIFNFINTDKNGVLKAVSDLHEDPFVSQKDLLTAEKFPFEFFKRPFAFISIQLAADLRDEYLLSFQALSTYWRYILVSTHLLEMENLQILVDQSEYQFSSPAEKELPNGQASLIFESLKPIPLSSITKPSCSLVQIQPASAEGYFTVKRRLPIPNPKSISNYATASSKTSIYSEMYIY